MTFSNRKEIRKHKKHPAGQELRKTRLTTGSGAEVVDIFLGVSRLLTIEMQVAVIPTESPDQYAVHCYFVFNGYPFQRKMMLEPVVAALNTPTEIPVPKYSPPEGNAPNVYVSQFICESEELGMGKLIVSLLPGPTSETLLLQLENITLHSSWTIGSMLIELNDPKTIVVSE